MSKFELVFACLIVEVFAMLCGTWYHLYSLKNVKNNNGGVILLVKLFNGQSG